jgi:hypothetical protein
LPSDADAKMREAIGFFAIIAVVSGLFLLVLAMLFRKKRYGNARPRPNPMANWW